MDTLPIELLIEIAQHLPVREYFRFRSCSSATLALEKAASVNLSLYEQLTYDGYIPFAVDRPIRLKAEDIHDESFLFLAGNAHQSEFIRILTGPHGKKISPEAKELSFRRMASYENQILSKMTIALLREGKLNPNLPVHGFGSGGWCLIHWACYKGDADVVQYLLSMDGVDVSKRTNTSRLPHHYSALNGHLDVTKLLLLDSRFDFEAKDKDGKSCLDLVRRI
jgi:Ankyrin repeats (3 copies)/F-box domain